MLSTSTLSVTEDANTPYTYTVKLAAKPTGTVTVAIGSSNGDVAVDTDAGTAGNQNSLTFNASGSKLWNEAQTVTVNARGDANTASEAVTLTHTASGGGYGAVRKTLSGTVVDDGKKTVAFSQREYSVIEGKGPVTVTLVMSEARSATTNVRVSATPLTATGHGVDYTGQSWTAMFAAGSTSANIEIPITADNRLEEANGERFRVDIHDFGLPGDLKRVKPDAAYVKHLRRGGPGLHAAANDDGLRRRAPARVHPERARAVFRRGRRVARLCPRPTVGASKLVQRLPHRVLVSRNRLAEGAEPHRNPGGQAERPRTRDGARGRAQGRTRDRDPHPD